MFRNEDRTTSVNMVSQEYISDDPCSSSGCDAIVVLRRGSFGQDTISTDSAEISGSWFLRFRWTRSFLDFSMKHVKTRMSACSIVNTGYGYTTSLTKAMVIGNIIFYIDSYFEAANPMSRIEVQSIT